MTVRPQAVTAAADHHIASNGAQAAFHTTLSKPEMHRTSPNTTASHHVHQTSHISIPACLWLLRSTPHAAGGCSCIGPSRVSLKPMTKRQALALTSCNSSCGKSVFTGTLTARPANTQLLCCNLSDPFSTGLRGLASWSDCNMHSRCHPDQRACSCKQTCEVTVVVTQATFTARPMKQPPAIASVSKPTICNFCNQPSA
jgi:hypothetical protein